MATQNGLGLQVEEERGPEHLIEYSDTARTAFVGRTLRGPVNAPVRVVSFAEFQHTFGGLWQPSPLGYAVEQFFANGGREAFVVRVVNGARAAMLNLPAGGQTLNLRALRPGTREFLRASVDYDNIAAANAAEFNLTVQRVRIHGTEQIEDQEIYPRLSLLPDAERYVGHAFAHSDLIRLAGDVPARRPDLTVDAGSGLATGYINSSAGDDGAPLTDYDLIGSKLDGTGLFALDRLDYFNLLCVPPPDSGRDVNSSVLLVATRYCKERRALLIVDPPAAWHTAEEAQLGLKRWEFASDSAVMFFPRILAHDKLRGRIEAFAPCGAVAGMLSRWDETAPVWGPPRLDEAILRPGHRPSCLVTADGRRRLAALGVNTLQAVRSSAQSHDRLRTLAAGSAGASDWQLLATRRLALFILNSVERGTRWVVHTKPHRDVAEQAAAQVNAFFLRLHAARAFGSLPAEESFFVVCDRRVNGAGDAASCNFQIVIGFAAARPREFHCFRIAHGAAGSKVSPVSLNVIKSAPVSLDDLPIEFEDLEFL